MKTYVCAGIDIGGTNSEIGLIDREGNLLFTARLSTRAYPLPALFAKDLAVAVNKGLQETGTLLKGIGIGAPSANYYTGSIDRAPNMPWPGIIPLAKMMKDETQVPCVITNDANAAALGEQLFGAAKFMRDFVVVTLGTGLGSGFVTNNEVIYGHDGFAGELGHVIVERNGRLCNCGRKGCLETYVSATGIVTTAKEWLEFEGEDSRLKKIPVQQLESRHIAEAAAKGDLLALRIINYTAELLGLALANMVAITSPSHIFLYGGLAKAGELLLAPTRRYFEENLLRNYSGKVTIELSGLPDNAAVLGAAALAWKEVKE
jgi:glucokinase